ncbi:MAG: AsmA-like C-terminal region-containing protein [Chitinophagaceae bacterium]|nr:AsmA-like C-terminal region-containing protein [Chitinophagaceae bacterium]
MLKKALKITGIIFLLLIAFAFATPILFKGRILSLAKTEINNNLNARVDFKDVSISLFRNFPKLSAGLDNISVTGAGDFATDTLLSAKRIDVALNLLSVISGGNMKIYAVTIDEPRIHAIINKDGKANWDIAKPDTASAGAATEEPFQMSLQKYTINNGYISYTDLPGNMSAEIFNLDHSGKGDFTSDLFTLSTDTKAEAVNFTYENIPYLASTKTSIGADVQVDNKTNTYRFKTDEIKLNDMQLATEGFFQLANDSTYNMDIKFNAPSTGFKTLLSLIPSVYKKDFDKIKTDGKAVFKGFVKGTYNNTKMPAYNVNLEITNGFFQYPDLPRPVKNISLSLKVDNPDGVTDHTLIDIPKAHIEFGNDPFDFRLILKNPETSRYIDAAAKGRLDLAQVTQFVKMEAGTKLSGLLQADAFVKGNLAAIENQQGEFTAGGFFNISNLFYSSKDFPQPIKNGSIKAVIENNGGAADQTAVNITSGHIEVGNNPVDFTLQLKKPVSTVEFAGTAKGQFNLEQVKQFTTLEPGTSVSGMLNADLAFSGSKTAVDKKQYDQVNTTGTASLQNVKYISKDYPSGVIISSTQLSFNPKNVTVNEFTGNYLGTAFNATGVLNNIIGYALQNQTLDGSLNVKADKMNLNEWMPSDTATEAAASPAGAFAIPANINFAINARADEVKYDKVTYSNINGAMIINDETVKLKDVKTEALDGNITFNGSYSTLNNKKQPDIAMSYEVKNVDVQKTFYAFNTVQKLMPVGKFLSGKLSSALTMTGKLGKEMMPDLSSLNGTGNILLLQGVLKKFAPMEKLAETLGLADLNEISVKDVKNYIEFTNGKVFVKPFKLQVKDINMEIGGTQGIDQSLDYVITLKVPRALMGNKGNAMLNNLVSQANAKGIPAKLSDVVDLNVKMLGTITSPQFKFDLKETSGNITEQLKQQATDFAKHKTDSVKNVASATGKELKDSAKSIKNQAVKELKDDFVKKLTDQKDTSQKDSSNTLDKAKKSTEQTIKNTFDNLFKKKKSKKDSVGG